MRTRGERVFVALFCAANLILPILFVDLYPFSSFPMFSDRTARATVLEVWADGAKVDPYRLDLGTLATHNPAPRIGRRWPIHEVGTELLEQRALEAHLRAHWAAHPSASSSVERVTVHQKIYVAPPGGGVAVVEQGTWQVENPDPGAR